MDALFRQVINVPIVTPNLASFVTPYSSGDVLGGLNTIPLAVMDPKCAAELASLVVLDAANQKSKVDLVFLNGIPANSFGADNAAYALNDADLPLVIGRLSIADTDYVSSGSTNAEATLRGLGLILQAVQASRTLYCIAVSRGTPTYGSASDLSFKLGLKEF